VAPAATNFGVGEVLLQIILIQQRSVFVTKLSAAEAAALLLQREGGIK